MVSPCESGPSAFTLWRLFQQVTEIFPAIWAVVLRVQGHLVPIDYLKACSYSVTGVSCVEAGLKLETTVQHA
jgi:hypothetical protein